MSELANLYPARALRWREVSQPGVAYPLVVMTTKFLVLAKYV